MKDPCKNCIFLPFDIDSVICGYCSEIVDKMYFEKIIPGGHVHKDWRLDEIVLEVRHGRAKDKKGYD